MLELNAAIPPGALCDAPSDALAADLADTGAQWWDGTGLQADTRTGAVTCWTPRLGDTDATPTDPNEGNAQIGEAGDLTGLQCRDGTHCGMVAQDVADNAATVTLALRYLPPHLGEARTLLTLNTGGAARKEPGENYLFLSDAEGTLTVKDDNDLVATTLPLPATDAPRFVLVSLRGDHLTATAMDGPQAGAQASAPVLTGPASLFIGCRNQRPGLLKTLGGALICDVWLWPGRAVLDSDAPDDRAILRALRRFHLWAGDT